MVYQLTGGNNSGISATRKRKSLPKDFWVKFDVVLWRWNSTLNRLFLNFVLGIILDFYCTKILE